MNVLTPDDLRLVTPGGGWTIAQQLAHSGAATAFWTGRLDRSAVAGLPAINPDEPPLDAFGFEPAEAVSYLTRVNDAALRAADSVGDWTGRSHASASSFLAHMMVHAAHHRSQIVLTLKTADRPLPDDGNYWGPWKTNPEA